MDEPDSPLIRVVVCDAGPLIHLDELDCLGLLSDFSEVLVPTKVWAEVARHRPRVLSQQNVALRRVQGGVSAIAELESIARTLALDAGELEALRVVRELKADLLLSDDTAARLAALSLGIPVHGTIGILLRSIRRKQRTATEVAAILRLLPSRSTLHLKPVLLDEIIRQVEAIG